MKKVRIALTLAVMLGALGLGVARKSVRQAGSSDPQGTVYAMFDAARAGDVKNYLASYAGSMDATLRQVAAESGGFPNYLRESTAAVKGIAVQDSETAGDGEVRVRVETVYQDRNETQWMYLRKEAGGWKISRVESEERIPTLIPYGTPVRAVK